MEFSITILDSRAELMILIWTSRYPPILESDSEWFESTQMGGRGLYTEQRVTLSHWELNSLDFVVDLVIIHSLFCARSAFLVATKRIPDNIVTSCIINQVDIRLLASSDDTLIVLCCKIQLERIGMMIGNMIGLANYASSCIYIYIYIYIYLFYILLWQISTIESLPSNTWTH